jgi:hypothetical protein
MRSLSRIRLTHPALDLWVDVAPSRPNGQWLAVACLAGSPEPAVAGRADLARLLGLRALGRAIAQRRFRRVLRDGVVAEGALA